MFCGIFCHHKKKQENTSKKIDDYFLIPHLDYEVSNVTSEVELEQIIALARANYSCPINGMDFKKPIWQKNPYTFFIVQDENLDVKANINLFPLTEEAFLNLKSGKILESEITVDDILSDGEKDRNQTKYIYVEGLLSKSETGKTSDKNALILIGWNFDKIVSKLSSDPSQVIFCAIGGSLEGKNLMTRLGFHIANPSNNRKDKLDFFVVEHNKLKQNLHNKTLIGTIQKIISKNNKNKGL